MAAMLSKVLRRLRLHAVLSSITLLHLFAIPFCRMFMARSIAEDSVQERRQFVIVYA
jgi:hypothetical protein